MAEREMVFEIARKLVLAVEDDECRRKLDDNAREYTEKILWSVDDKVSYEARNIEQTMKNR